MSRSDPVFSWPESHSSILALAAEGEGSATAGLRKEKDAPSSTLEIGNVIVSTAGMPPQLPSLSPVTDMAIDGNSTCSLGTEHMDHRYLDAIVVEHSAVGHTSSSIVEVPSSPTPILNDFPSIGTLLSFDSAVILPDHISLLLESHS